ncbi:putative porin [Patiriisocius marinus]|uniref:putative porin n=1 Tax=Patiriisocius marinus TaxID=1397112 RepID=UPI00232F491C|nr:putative porin [Patiriisocius marinus]
MKHCLFLLIVLTSFGSAFAQKPERAKPERTKSAPKNEKPPITDYLIISAERDTTYVDTTLNIKKLYKFNYLRKDDFELLPFANAGQTYNSLSVDLSKNNLKPLFAAQSHHFNYKHIEDVNYYNVPTPLTELFYKGAFGQGQMLDAFFTVNTSRQFNFSINYKGLRSLGNYQQSLTSTGNLVFTTNYHTKNNRYNIKAHFAAQDVLNRENGGLTDNSLLLFINDDSEFSDRGRLDVNFEDAENKLEGIRFYGEQEYELIQRKDSTDALSIKLGNILSYEDRFFEYRQLTAYSPYGESFEATNLLSTTKLEDFNAKVYASANHSLFGNMTVFTGYTDFNYGYNTVLELDSGRIPNRIKGSILEAGAAYQKKYRGFELNGKAAINISGEFDGNYIEASAGYKLNEDLMGKASLHIHSATPNFNFLLYQNDYINYNWKNEFNNVKTQELRFDLQSNKLANVSVSYTGVDDYTYFAIQANDSTPTPQQATERVDYLKIKAERTFKWRTFALANTVMYQNVVGGNDVFNVPEFTTRQSLFYQDEWFKKALYLETGATFKYFTKYNMNAYDPVLAEFYVQNEQELGGFPLVDLFFNAKIRQTRIYFTWENFNSMFNSSNNYFSAPGYPYRDSTFRFGLVWDFFL